MPLSKAFLRSKQVLGVEHGGTGDPGAAMTTFTGGVTAASGVLADAVAVGVYRRIGKFIFGSIAVTINNNGTGSSAIQFTPPVPARADVIFVAVGREDAVVGVDLHAKITGTVGTIWADGNQYPGGTGRVLRLSFFYEAA